MGLFGRRKAAGRTGTGNDRLSYDDVEQLLMQVGIIGAFMLSISMLLEHQVLPGAMDSADFNGMLCFSQDFRDFVVERLEAKNFEDWEIPYAVNATLDSKAELLVHIGERFPGPRSFVDGIPFKECYADLKLAAVTDYLVEEFDMRHLRSYILMVEMVEGGRYASGSMTGGMASFSAQVFASVTTAFFFLNILLFCMLYVSLTLSSAREDETGEALEAWKYFGMPAIYLGYGLLLIGALLLVVLSNYYYYASGVSTIKKKTYDILFGLCIPVLGAGAVGFMLAGLAAFVNGERVSRRQAGEPKSKAELQPQL